MLWIWNSRGSKKLDIIRKSFEWITSVERNWISSPESSRQNLSKSKVIDDNCLQSSMKEIFRVAKDAYLRNWFWRLFLGGANGEMLQRVEALLVSENCQRLKDNSHWCVSRIIRSKFCTAKRCWWFNFRRLDSVKYWNQQFPESDTRSRRIRHNYVDATLVVSRACDGNEGAEFYSFFIRRRNELKTDYRR